MATDVNGDAYQRMEAKNIDRTAFSMAWLFNHDKQH